MAELTAIPQLPAFIPDADPTSVAQRWKRWSDRFENLIVALNVTDSTRKKALLLHLAGEAVYEIYEGLVVTPVAAEADPEVDNVYINLKKALDNHFNPKRNVEFEVYTFRTTQQNKDESTDAYHVRLRAMARYCEFTNLDSELKSHIIQTCTSTRLRRKALSEPDMTLQQLLDAARSMEAAERQLKSIESNHEASNTDTNVAAVQRFDDSRRPGTGRTVSMGRGKPPNTSTCRNCGGPFPHAGGMINCPSYGKRCSNCFRFNHVAKYCLTADPQARQT